MTAAPRNFDEPQPKYWTKRQYEGLVSAGAFEGENLFLFRGKLIEMSSQSADHAWAVRKLTAAMSQLFSPPTYYVNIQLPFSVPDDSLLEPDLAVCRASDLSAGAHASKALLIIEVAATSLAIDREKAMEYAAAGVAEYWIVNLNARCVEVYRDPFADQAAPLGFRYPPPTVVLDGDAIALVFDPSIRIKIRELLP
jgi:Uma2 family endonuclease